MTWLSKSVEVELCGCSPREEWRMYSLEEGKDCFAIERALGHSGSWRDGEPSFSLTLEV